MAHSKDEPLNADVPLFLVQGAAWLHLCQIPGMWVMGRRVMDIPLELRKLSPLASAVVRVIALAVLTLLVVIGVLIATHPEDALGTRLGRAQCLFLGLFWSVRLGVQVRYYTHLGWPRTRDGRVLQAMLVGIFAIQSLGYLGAWLLPF